MAAIRLHHTDNGYTHVYNQSDLTAHIAAGWEIVEDKPVEIKPAVYTRPRKIVPISKSSGKR